MSKRREVSPETRKKISDSLKGKMKGNQHAKGATRSPEHRAIISKTHRGKVLSAETREKIAKKLKGRKMSPETRAKMKIAARQRWVARREKEGKKL